jgi:hypothetical protein
LATTRCYLPVIVTNALLYTASFDASDLDMKTGQLPPGKCDFREVPCVRFRKSLGTHLTTQKEVEASNRDDAIVQQNRASQRTIIVLNSASISESMKALRLAERFPGDFGRTIEQLFVSERQRVSLT